MLVDGHLVAEEAVEEGRQPFDYRAVVGVVVVEVHCDEGEQLGFLLREGLKLLLEDVLGENYFAAPEVEEVLARAELLHVLALLEFVDWVVEVEELVLLEHHALVFLHVKLVADQL